MWFELSPAPRPDDGDDRDAYRRRAANAAARLGLASRPSIDTLTQAWRRDDGCILVANGARRYLCLPDGADPEAADALARAADATARECDPPDIPAGLVWAHAFVPRGATISRTAFDEPDKDDDVRLDPPAGQWVVVNVRRMGWLESRRSKNWLGDEFNMTPDTSKLQKAGVGVCRVSVGDRDGGRAHRAAEMAANALDLGVTPGFASHTSRPAWGLVALMLPLVAAAFAGFMLLNWPAWVLPAPILGLIMAVARLALTPRDAAVWQRPRHWWGLTRYREAQSADLKTRNSGDDLEAFGPHRKRRVHAYAFQRSTLPVPPTALAALARPSASRLSQGAALTVRPVGLETADGPRLGRDADGRDVRLASNVLYGGVVLLGRPGGGKSNSMHGLERWASEHASNRDAMVVFESKGVSSIPVLKRLMPRLLVVDVADPSTPMIDLLGPGTPGERGERFASLMRAALGDEQVGPASRLMIRDAVALALTVMPEPRFRDRCRAAGLVAPDTWPQFARVVLAGDGVSAARALAHAAVLAAPGPDVTSMVERLHGAVNPKTGRPAVSDGELVKRLAAPMNKMDLLARCPGVFAPGRRTVGWRQVIAHGATLAVNLGGTVRAPHATLGDDQRSLVGALLLRSLRGQMESSCAGWYDAGRHMRVFVDEMTEVLSGGGNEEVFRWCRTQGRAFGVEMTCGTQFPENLDPSLFSLLMDFDTRCTFVMRSVASSTQAGQALGVDPSMVSSLGEHMLLVRTVDADWNTLPPMVVRTPWFDNGEPA